VTIPRVIKIEMNDWLFKSRVVVCRATNCKNNEAYLWRFEGGLQCNLREVQMTEDGRCYFFEPVEETPSPLTPSANDAA